MVDRRTASDLTVAQERAVASLERALARCAKAGVAICGMDGDLIAYRADDFDRLRDEQPTGVNARGTSFSAYDVQSFLNNVAHTARPINDHGTYRDSGGW